LPRNITEFGIVSEINDEHPEKQSYPIWVTELGIVSDNNDEHPLKQPFPRDTTDFGIASDNNDEHSLKQSFPREVTEFGMMSDNSDEKFSKHFFPIEWTEFEMISLFNSQQLSKQWSGKQLTATGNSNDSIDWFKIVRFPLVILKFSNIKQNVRITISTSINRTDSFDFKIHQRKYDIDF
jgi:hypothetical protein